MTRDVGGRQWRVVECVLRRYRTEEASADHHERRSNRTRTRTRQQRASGASTSTRYPPRKHETEPERAQPGHGDDGLNFYDRVRPTG
jgi:hypothetical protein